MATVEFGAIGTVSVPIVASQKPQSQNLQSQIAKSQGSYSLGSQLQNSPSRNAQPATAIASSKGSSKPRTYHRIREVRLREGVSLRSAARQMGTDIRSLRLQEQESTDLRLSDLHRWQKALDVPLTEMVVDDELPLSRPILERARMLRLMKTAAAIRERATSPGIQRMAQMMVEQLVEIMPELKEVSPWHQFGQRRSLEEFGRVMERTFSDRALTHSGDDD